MKRNFKSILKYFIFILITAFVTTVIFKLSKKIDQHDNSDFIQAKRAIVNKQLDSNQIPKIDWHDWEFINLEKLRTGKIIFILFF